MSASHAYLCVCDDIAVSNIPAEYKTESVDVFHLLTEQLSVGTAKTLIQQSATRPVERGERVFVLNFKSATIEAQNALLKLFEDPPQQVVFYVVLSDPSFLLPTLRSRLVSLGPTFSKQDFQVAKDFLLLDYKDRLALITENVKAKDQTWIDELMNGLGNIFTGNYKEKNKQTLNSINVALKYIRIRGASKKTLLEDLALSLPERLKV